MSSLREPQEGGSGHGGDNKSIIPGMSDDRRVSEAMYVGLCRYIGSPTEVTIRREVKGMEEAIERTYEIRKGIIIMNSGSYREGFSSGSSTTKS